MTGTGGGARDDQRSSETRSERAGLQQPLRRRNGPVDAPGWTPNRYPRNRFFTGLLQSRSPVAAMYGSGMVEAEMRRSFGYKTGWFAVRDSQPAEVAEALGLLDQQAVGWCAGVESAYDAGVFVCPPIGGWVLAIGLEILLNPPDLAELSATLATEVQLFMSHRVSEYHVWSRAEDGAIVRAFGFCFDNGELTVNTGQPTEIEIATPEIFPALAGQVGSFPFEAYEPPNDPARLPGEESVMIVAAAWSLDPTQLTGENTRLGIYSDRAIRSAPSPRSLAPRRNWRRR
jgi:hypothetical protein